MAIPEEILQEIKYRVDIEDAISPYVQLKRRGRNLIGLCPFHNEKTPSFTVYPESGSFYCFGCGVGGDVFSFTRLIEGLDYIEAVKLLAERTGVRLPEDGYDDSLQKLKNRILDINRETARFYHKFLFSDKGKWALDYLLGRGLKIATIKHFGLGAAPDDWTTLYTHLRSLGFKDDELEQANVVSKGKNGSYYDRFRNRVMFPVINIRGSVIAFSGRARPGGEDKAKYINSSDTLVYKKSHNLFGINFAKNSCADRVILVEGNMDVVSLHQAGFTNTVAPLGTAFTPEQAKLLSRYTKEIVVTLDADSAGQKAVMRAIEMMKDSGMPIRVLVLPECKDPDEYIKKNGAGRFSALLEGAVSDTEYRLLKAAEGLDINSDNGRLEYLKQAMKILSTVSDSITVDFYVSRLSDKFGVSRTALNTSIDEQKKKSINMRKKQEIREAISVKRSRDDINSEKFNHMKAANAEETFLSVLLRHPNMLEKAKETVSPQQFVTSLNRRIYEAFCRSIEEHGQIELSVLGDKFSPSELGYIVRLQNGSKALSNPEEVLKDSGLVILKENMLNSSGGDRDMPLEDWQNKMQNLRKFKGRIGNE